MVDAVAAGFTPDDVERAARYHRPLYRLALVDSVVSVAVLALLTQLDLSLPWWADVVLAPAIVVAALFVARLPLGWLRHRHELAWGLSTQTARGWASDRVRSLLVGAVLTIVGIGGLLALAHLFPDAWPWVAAAAGAFLALVLAFVAPVLLEPLFNRFRPLDGALATELRALARRAGVPVREVLVADASRRTRKVNAYVSGIGRTRRVVVWDTLLACPEDEVAVVVAHELGHRKLRHVVQSTLLAVAGVVVSVAILRALVPHPRPDQAALVLLVATGLEVAALPLLNLVSRRWERAADRFSVELTGDRRAFLALHRRIARANLSDLDPPALLYLWTYSHPTVPERIAAAG